MRSCRFLSLASAAVAVVAILVAPPARAIQPDVDLEALEIRLPDYGFDLSPQHAGARTLTTAAATEIGGRWEVYRWSPASETAAWVYGSGAELPGSAMAGNAALEQAARSFIAAHPSLFHAQEKDLVLDAVARGAGKVGIHFRQLYRGIPIMNSRVSLIITEESGTIVAFGSEFYSDPDLNTSPSLTSSAALAAAQSSLSFNPTRDRVDGAPDLVIVPVRRFEGGATMRLAWRVLLSTQEPHGIWQSFVDAKNGEIFWRVNDVESLYSGTSKGDVERPGYCNGNTPNSPFRDMTITIGALGSATTDSTGNFSLDQSAGNQTATAAFDGTRANINRQDGQPDASQSLPIQDNVPLAIQWSNANSNVAERDVFFWVSATYAYMEDIDPLWFYSKYTVNINIAQTCNANWSGTVMNFFEQGGGCANTGRIGDVVAHEFGHGVQQLVVGNQGNQGLGDGNADIMGTFLSDDAFLGRGFFLNNCGSPLRNCENNLVYPTHVVGQEEHAAGRVICGFNWDTRQELELSLGAAQGKAVAARTWHFGRKVFRPMEQPDQVLAYFVIDDNDGNMINGTPHYDEICVGAENHGFDCPTVIPVYIVHTPLEDTQDSQNPYPVVAQVFAFDGNLVADSVRVNYKTNFGAFSSIVMTPTANPDEFMAPIPAQPMGTLIQYYISAADDVGQRNTSPPNGPGATYGFFIGTLDAAADHTMETDPGWSVGQTTATRGMWERGDPIGVNVFVQGVPHVLQPEDDHTPAPGVQCWITQNAGSGFDVTGGFTTLNTAIYNLAGEQYVRVSYWLWYSNQFGNNPNEDAFDFDVSTNGGSTWTNIDSRLANTGEAWQKVKFDIRNYAPITSQMRFRFIARDLLGPSLVEAGVDDFKIEILPGAQGVGDPVAAPASQFAVDQNVPNPFNPSTEIHYSLPFAMAMSLKIYDVEGRMIRTLAEGTMTAGDHVATWDGRDSQGTSVASGIYYYRLESPEYGATRKMVLMK